MTDLLDRVLDTAPKSGKPVIKWVVTIVIAATVGVFLNEAANARIMRKTRPLRIRVGEQDAVLNHIFEDHEEDRQVRGEKPHNLLKVREEGRKKAIEEEKEDTLDEK